MDITDEQIRAACRVYDLDPVGRVPVEGYTTDLDPGDNEGWDDHEVWEFASDVLVWKGQYPDAGPLGFAAGHLSPGWRFLRELLERIAAELGTDYWAAFDYQEARDHIGTLADDLARKRNGALALVCVADLGVDESTEDASVYVGEVGCCPLDSLAWALLSYAGQLVCREVFAPQIESKPKD
jgi:hypothetical protein